MRAEDVESPTVRGLLDLVAERRSEDDAMAYAGWRLRYSYYWKFKEIVERHANH